MYLGGVSVAYEKERTPPEWSVVPKTVNGHDADLNAGTKLPLLGGAKMYICVRPLNHQDSHYITNVTVIHEGKEAVPLGHEVVRRSVSGKDANLNAKSGGSKLYLCVKREPRYTMSTLTISGDASFVDVDQKYAYSFERELRIKAG
ncbi:hypothetical protein PTSG_04840 [Salpingoeca rosetta]|uniref:MABP domain-containing protein n=1 Tax=Salpingoeca rosetta (strain ATCC 50818 / BSB-021) TaxID=946362 RepID=F2U9V0_SALR5|nr:uncharacterized protein PTSG_04840 [Salpingoeca rosetta]EGD73127.1 hypothetical protein PTSG_04840 [Salpingoeca rosetta]|eukprot:XP_004994158.1 hypothetical protein PTSG_04840 [Salpingoeca rosetta]